MEEGVRGWSDAQARVHVEQVEALLAALEDIEGPSGEAAAAAVEALVDLYGACLQRVMAYVTHRPPAELAAALARDELVGHVLMAHGLVPDPPELTAPSGASGAVPVTFLGRRS